jgi:hypothetical protein
MPGLRRGLVATAGVLALVSVALAATECDRLWLSLLFPVCLVGFLPGVGASLGFLIVYGGTFIKLGTVGILALLQYCALLWPGMLYARCPRKRLAQLQVYLLAAYAAGAVAWFFCVVRG